MKSKTQEECQNMETIRSLPRSIFANMAGDRCYLVVMFERKLTAEQLQCLLDYPFDDSAIVDAIRTKLAEMNLTTFYILPPIAALNGEIAYPIELDHLEKGDFLRKAK